VKERSSPSKKDASLDSIMTKLFSGLDDDNDLGMRNGSRFVVESICTLFSLLKTDLHCSMCVTLFA